MRSDLRRGSPFPDILEELPVEKRSLTQNQYSYLKPHVCCSIGKLKLLRIQNDFRHTRIEHEYRVKRESAQRLLLLYSIR